MLAHPLTNGKAGLPPGDPAHASRITQMLKRNLTTRM